LILIDVFVAVVSRLPFAFLYSLQFGFEGFNPLSPALGLVLGVPFQKGCDWMLHSALTG
jgi:hypothetical protein